MKNIKGINKKQLKLVNKVMEKQEIKNGDLEAIARKGLSVIYSCSKNTNKYIIEILENKHNDTLEEIKQEIYINILENGYIINGFLNVKKCCFKVVKNNDTLILLDKKNAFRCINNYIYKRKKEQLHEMEIFTTEEKQTNYDYISYMQYITKNENNYKKHRLNIEELGLTRRQKEILNIYATTQSICKVAELLGISKQAVSKTIKAIQNKVLQVA